VYKRKRKEKEEKEKEMERTVKRKVIMISPFK
jgi:hypothetical protein